MDDDLRNAFATLSAQISVVATDLRANTSLTADLSRKVSDVAVEQRSQAGRIHVIEKHVFGSAPPPPPKRPMAESLSEHDGDIAEVKGQLIAVQTELEKQSKKMNIDAKGFWKFIHNTTVQDVAKLATLAAALYAALHGAK
jgi:hypothetical protein